MSIIIILNLLLLLLSFLLLFICFQSIYTCTHLSLSPYVWIFVDSLSFKIIFAVTVLLSFCFFFLPSLYSRPFRMRCPFIVHLLDYSTCVSLLLLLLFSFDVWWIKISLFLFFIPGHSFNWFPVPIDLLLVAITIDKLYL